MTRISWTGDELAEHGDSLVHRLVIPRPIAWVSTRSADGIANLAPHSFYTVVSTQPPILLISTTGMKDTATNAIATGEFVVSVSTEPETERVNLTGTRYPAELDEFAEVGLTPLPSLLVAPPSVAESPAAMECRLVRHETVGNGVLLFGEVVAVTVDESVLGERGPEATKLAPVARLGGAEWTTLGTISARRRLPYTPKG